MNYAPVVSSRIAILGLPCGSRIAIFKQVEDCVVVQDILLGRVKRGAPEKLSIVEVQAATEGQHRTRRCQKNGTSCLFAHNENLL